MSADDPIVLEGVRRRFGERFVLRGLDLRVRRGQIHALLGRNGSGKTTAIRILLGLLAPHGGVARIGGKDSRALTPDDRGRIGYVTEGHHLYLDMRVDDVVSFEAGTRAGFDRGFAQEAARRCGLAGRQRVLRLSRGQRAQLAIVVALAARPEVLVLDDPALGLDVVMRRELLEVMIDLLASRGTTVLFSSHFLSDVERVADRVSLVHEGRVIVDATLDALRARVQQRLWVAGDGAAPPALSAVLRAERRLVGWNLLLIDLDEATEARLREGGARLDPPGVPTLEDLFLALTRGDRARLFPESDAAAEGKKGVAA